LNIIAIVILSILFSCNSEDKLLSNLEQDISILEKKSVQFKCESSLFNKVGVFADMEGVEADFEFYRIANSDSIINRTCYQLYYLKSKSGEMAGYWGERNDSILFIPYKTDASVSTEYFIYNKTPHGYFSFKNNVRYNNDLFNSIIGSGYSYKAIVSGKNFASLLFYVDPKYIENISQKEYIFESIPLIMNIDYNLGVIFFSYDYYLNKQLVIPWAEQLLYREFPP
tara:strand:+ start:64 stop:741 length:678 start_codon:yes stop_codon:yes gene_type:complete